VSPRHLTKAEMTWVDKYFRDQIFPVLTPLSIDPAHPFPFIPNFGFSIALELTHRRRKDEMVAVLRLPVALNRFVRLPDRGKQLTFVTLENLVGMHVADLFPGYTLKGSGTFRILRDSDIEVEEEAEDLVRLFETALKRRRRGSVIRLEISAGMPEALRAFVAQQIGVSGDRISVQQ